MGHCLFQAFLKRAHRLIDVLNLHDFYRRCGRHLSGSGFNGDLYLSVEVVPKCYSRFHIAAECDETGASSVILYIRVTITRTHDVDLVCAGSLLGNTATVRHPETVTLELVLLVQNLLVTFGTGVPH